ncbi:MAG: DUF1178 family protein [Deltaproteobacteria bacterium]|jgi:hypothetical protein|nr:DUF1178 family protein [Deltaproteobacteria bacterium]
MVIFDMICPNDHRFEGWFSDLADLEDQLARGLLSCPICGDTHIQRRPSTFGLVKSRQAVTQTPDGQDTLEGKKEDLVRQLENLSDRLREDFTDVGPSFSDEALKMHYGASPRRNIMGRSTGAEEELLRKEGVEFFKAPMLVRKPSTAN